MTQLIDALKKAGLISEEEAEKAKRLKAQEEAKTLKDKFFKPKTKFSFKSNKEK